MIHLPSTSRPQPLRRGHPYGITNETSNGATDLRHAGWATNAADVFTALPSSNKSAGVARENQPESVGETEQRSCRAFSAKGTEGRAFCKSRASMGIRSEKVLRVREPMEEALREEQKGYACTLSKPNGSSDQ